MSKKPNIIIMITDQQQKYTTEPNSSCLMPNIDFLRSEGISFSKAYTTNAICSPARASLMTGLLPHNHGMVDCTHNVDDYRASFRESKCMISQQLKNEGYRLGYFGKWHIERSHELERFGFDEYETERDLPEFQKTMIDAVKISQPGYNDKVLCGVYEESGEETEEHYLYTKGIDFIKRNAQDHDKPWCLFVSTYAPHDPYVVPKEYYDLYNPDDLELPDNFYDDMKDKPGIYRRIKRVWKDMDSGDYKQAMACYYAYCTLVDTQIGRIMQALEETGQANDTIVVFLTDHGDMMGGHGLFCKGVFPFEEVYHIPLFIKWPQSQMKGYTSNVLMNLHDVAPTLLEMAGCRGMSDIDGESIVPYLKGEKEESAKSAFAEFHGQRLFYTQRIIWRDHYKYIFNGFDNDEFYDLETDPGEMSNLIEDAGHKDKIEAMAREMWSIVKRTGDFNLYETEYFMFRFAPFGPEMNQEKSIYNK